MADQNKHVFPAKYKTLHGALHARCLHRVNTGSLLNLKSDPFYKKNVATIISPICTHIILFIKFIEKKGIHLYNELSLDLLDNLSLTICSLL